MLDAYAKYFLAFRSLAVEHVRVSIFAKPFTNLRCCLHFGPSFSKSSAARLLQARQDALRPLLLVHWCTRTFMLLRKVYGCSSICVGDAAAQHIAQGCQLRTQ